ncbi:MAG: glycosyltransferase family 2 protein [Anaerolineales bacterium]|nr:glycosyltransferase family 2 protein [Anaerolineales bacterium]
MQPFLSIIIPALDEEGRLPASLDSILAFLQAQPFRAEVLVVDNGSRDATYAVAQSYARRIPWIRVLQEPRRGKGAAVRQGMLAAQGQFRFIADADLSMPIEQVLGFLPPGLSEMDIAIASREAPGAARYGEPPHRHLIGRAFNWLVRLLAVPGFQDTQCGFKMFRDHVALDLFQVQQLEGWTFDVEVLFIALRRGYRIAEVPIPWTFNPGSRVSVLRDSFAMLRDLFRIRRLWKQGAYAPRVQPE